jgi:hypothetical protein
MDSKLPGSNIGRYSRYGIAHEAIRKYCAANGITGLEGKGREQLAEVPKEKGGAVTCRDTKDEAERKFGEPGTAMYRLLEAEGGGQYEAVSGAGGGKEKRVKGREKGGASGKSVQNPHDGDSEYRDKGGKKVKGYSVNVAENCGEGGLNLIVDVRAEGGGTADVEYLQDGMEKAREAVADKIEEVYADGAYHSPEKQEYRKGKGIDRDAAGHARQAVEI